MGDGGADNVLWGGGVDSRNDTEVEGLGEITHLKGIAFTPSTSNTHWLAGWLAVTLFGLSFLS